MIDVQLVRADEMDSTKILISSIFPDSMVSISEYDLLIVAKHRAKIVGFVHLVDKGDRILIQGLGVSERMRNRGIGTRLLEGALSLVADAGGCSIGLKVKALNSAVLLYERFGFVMKRFDGSTFVLVRRDPN